MERRTGHFSLDGKELELIDLPGTYSLFPNSTDERIACEVLLQPRHRDYPEMILYVADANQLDRQLLFFSQIKDLGFPVILIVSLIDTFEKAGHKVDLQKLSEQFKVPVFAINSKEKSSRVVLLDFLRKNLSQIERTKHSFYDVPEAHHAMLEEAAQNTDIEASTYLNWLRLHHREWLDLPVKTKGMLQKISVKYRFEPLKSQIEETLSRLQVLEPLAAKVISRNPKVTFFFATD